MRLLRFFTGKGEASVDASVKWMPVQPLSEVIDNLLAHVAQTCPGIKPGLNCSVSPQRNYKSEALVVFRGGDAMQIEVRIKQQ